MEVAGKELKTVTMDHHGLVAAVCHDLKIAERIDEQLGPCDARRVVSPGKAVVAMIINGLGFTNRRLYLTHQFFKNKPVEVLLGGGIQASDLTDYTLGHTLDDIAHYGASELFGKIAFDIALTEQLLEDVNHLDTTSFSVSGEYTSQRGAEVMKITPGYSKDHRPDLNQVVLSLVVNGTGSIPLWMEPLDGNSSDKKSFHDTVEKVRHFQSQIKLDKGFRWVADSALYNKERLLKAKQRYLWVTRVPETIKEAKAWVSREDEALLWQAHGNGYKTVSGISVYGGVKQRWLLVHSEQASQREKQTFEKRLVKQDEALRKALWHLSNQVFSCQADGELAVKQLVRKYRYFKVSYEVIAIERYRKAGRPSGCDEKAVVGYRVLGKQTRDEAAIGRQLNAKGRFILATNDLDKSRYCDEKLLSDYKNQQKVEGGFRFLKDPWFMLDSIFLKKAKRIEGLMMVMTLCLLVYNVAQYKLRKKLAETKETLPNQLGKGVQNPTVRWIFQIMEGISIVRFYEDNIEKPVKQVMTNLTDVRKKIIQLFGQTACRLYGLIEKSPEEVLGM